MSVLGIFGMAVSAKEIAFPSQGTQYAFDMMVAYYKTAYIEVENGGKLSKGTWGNLNDSSMAYFNAVGMDDMMQEQLRKALLLMEDRLPN
jgi:hypothetical protein